MRQGWHVINLQDVCSLSYSYTVPCALYSSPVIISIDLQRQEHMTLSLSSSITAPAARPGLASSTINIPRRETTTKQTAPSPPAPGRFTTHQEPPRAASEAKPAGPLPGQKQTAASQAKTTLATTSRNTTRSSHETGNHTKGDGPDYLLKKSFSDILQGSQQGFQPPPPSPSVGTPTPSRRPFDTP